MSEPVDTSSTRELLAPTLQRKGRPIFAWAVIVVLVLAIVLLPKIVPLRSSLDTGVQTDLLIMKSQSRYLVGTANLIKALLGKPDPQLYEQAKTLNAGSVEQRLRFVVLAGELQGPAEAQKQLHALAEQLAEQAIDLTAEQAALKKILDQLYSDYAKQKLEGPSLTQAQRDLLRQKLGWFGDLALAPASGPDAQARAAALGPAYRASLLYFGGLIVIGLVGLVGLVGLILFLVFLFTRRLKTGVKCGSSHGGVYAETFALYLLLYVGLSVASGGVATERWRLLLSGIAALLSLSALLWPVLRGVPWRQVREETGFTLGRRPGLEPLIGLGGYAMAVPLLLVGVMITLLILHLQGRLKLGGDGGGSFDPRELPSHPVVQFLLGPDWWGRVQVLLLGCIVAPIVEETMFRGVLYRHLREATTRIGFAGSILLSAALVSFIFAVIHPQGLAAIPPLMALAFAFNLVREWRGTVVPGMVAHGINNGLVMIVAIVALSD